ncbi:phosphatidylserine/phosphatidylglycerophosphate/cardiolipin synthase family protein [Achromobacter sp. MFA1 R4]|uniref:phospholipase D-like domain-containing protein n=1 Tax=Achromobacter sp. MFA1 R4 TaxID=1881016 RepID=UPI0009539A67|nr:phospholipase D-like domain-containing protein [Achromobacter sp. MFA1 R4]SIT07894.1 PLD-like domain-containing protein [Achromobacter sp. MFA1 R4]
MSEDTFTVSLYNKRDVRATFPWFVPEAKYPPRPANLILPLINGERAFKAVQEAISGAKKSVDIVSWGFDPSMRLVPGGERLGDLLRRKAEGTHGPDWQLPVEIRILIWKNVLNFKENNLPGDGVMGSGGGTGMGSGVGGLASAGGEPDADRNGFNNYGGSTNSAAVKRGDDEARKFNREWFRYQSLNIEFRTRDYGVLDRSKISLMQVIQRGLGTPAQRNALALAASHHQKTILVDYEIPEHAVGFVMGHNLLRNYWDTDAHEYQSAARQGFMPWQDLSSQVYGPVLYDLNENFMTAWDKAQGLGSKFFWTGARTARRSEDYVEPAQKRGKGALAQICRTQSQESERSILASYKLAIGNARKYLYFENQYFRYRDLAMLLRETRRKLKSAGWQKDLYVFVVTNVPDDHGRGYTHAMLLALGQGHRMPAYHRQTDDRGPDAELRKTDLQGVNIIMASLCTTGTAYWGGNEEVPKQMHRYAPIYVHSKLLLVDDVFFTLGSANVNTRSMESDSELNIACPSPELTQHWRKRLWKMHGRYEPGDDIADEFRSWEKAIGDNTSNMKDGKPLASSLIDFHDSGEKSSFSLD